MSILITGGAGYIGSHTDLCLLNEGYDIVVVDNYDNSSPEALRRVMELTGKTFPYYEADACDEEKLAEIMKKHGVDSVIHFAGLKAVGESVRIPLRYYENNLLSTIRLLKAMETVGVKKMMDILGAPYEDVVVFGDGLNDVSMFLPEWTSIAMGNAKAPLKELADYITDDCDKDGILKACQHFGWVPQDL